MKVSSSRRQFLATGLAVPGLGAVHSHPEPASPLPLTAQAAPELRYRTLGKTGIKVTSVAFGCMITSDASVIEKAADLGINHFDTARSYQSGNNERMVGAAIKSKRNNIILSSKTGARNAQQAQEHLETSLRELGTDHLDIWYLHARSTPDQVTDELIEVQQKAKKAGKIRFAGVSTHAGQTQLIPYLAKRTDVFDVILTAYNFTLDPAMNDVIAAARKAGVGIVAMKVMAGGFRRIKPDDPMYNKLKREGAMLAMLKWVLKNPNVDTTIPSITDMDQLDENLKAMTQPFGSTDEKLLAMQLDHIRPLYCRMCGQCSGTCPKGLPVSDILRYLSYAEGYGQFGLGREQFLQLPQQVRDVRCSDCASCPIQCPNGVKVAERLIRAQELFA